MSFRERIKPGVHLRLRVQGFIINCRTGHAGLVEELFLKRRFDIPSGDIVDCGANIGLFALSVSRKARGKIFCIEPDPANIALLRKNLEQNHVPATVLPVAAGEMPGELRFVSTKNAVGSHVMQEHERLKENERIVKVRVEPLDRIISQQKIDPAFIKIDVEGYEMETLAGLKQTLKRYHPLLLIEVHQERFYEQIHSFLAAFQYRQFKRAYGDSIICS